MKVKVLKILLLISVSLSSQTTTHFLFYKSDSTLYKYERKVENKDKVVYYRNEGKNTVGVEYTKKNHKDSFILIERYFSLNRQKSKLEKFQECDAWLSSSNVKGDTVTLTGMITNYGDTSISYIEVGDTTLYGLDAKESWNFSKRIKNAQLPLIINNTVKFNLDSANFIDSTVSIYKNGFPIKISRFRKGELTHVTTCEVIKNTLYYKNYFVNNKKQEYYRIDSFILKSDLSELYYYLNRFDETTYKSKIIYKVSQDLLEIYYKDSTKRTMKFVDKSQKNIIEYIITQNMLYDDVPFTFYSRKLENGKTFSLNDKTYSEKNKYFYDNSQNLIKIEEYQKEKLTTTIKINKE
jgi:hypothetical protein